MASILQATPQHLDAIADLFNQYRMWYGKDSDLSGARQFLETRLHNHESVIFIAVAGEQVVAFTQVYPLFSSTRMKRLWLLNDLFVTDTFRGQGLSKLLLERVKTLCHETGACGFTLETAKTNTVGNALYPAVGMQLNTEFNFYYWDTL